MGEDVPYNTAGITEIPVRWDIDDAIYFKFLGAGDKPPRSHLDIGAQWQSEAQSTLRHGGLFMMTVHDWISGRPARVDMLETLWQPLVENDAIWCATCGDIARHHQTVTDQPDHSLPRLPDDTTKGFYQ